MNWCFAIINNRLAEVFFEKKNGKIHFISHAYVKKEAYKTKHEQAMIQKDTAKVVLNYQKGKYLKT